MVQVKLQQLQNWQINFKKRKKIVLLVAADTFRAAAAEQLNEWADKIGTDFLRDADKSDPASVVYKSIAYANKNILT